MLDPFSALNVATAVVQFLDFGIQFADAAHKIYTSADGLTEKNTEVLGDSQRLEHLTSKLKATSDSDAWAPSEKALLIIAGHCQEAAKELSSMVQELRLEKDKSKTWDAVRRAWKTMRKKDTIDNLTRRLDRLRGDLCVHMIDVLRDQTSSMQSSLRHLINVSMSMRLGIQQELERTRQDLIDALKSPQQAASNAEDNLATKMNTVRQCVTEAKKYQSILHSLYYQEMPMRYIQIPEAYVNTNAWIFEDEESPFRSWLLNSSGVFWISGKAGSGKSTLVKFLADSEMTKALLENWVGSQENSAKADRVRKVVKAGYYFWKSGYPIQKSLRGLYQCLLYNIFHQCPTLIPLVCPTRWQALNEPESTVERWSQEELTATVHALVEIDTWPSWFCFFIDGLDEYDGTTNDQYIMIQDLNHLATSKFVKICVSSRPWNVFRAAYGQDPSRMMVLQDHNRADLDLYISGKLESDGRFRRLAESDARAKGFALEIRQRADGVFLWVFLVVRSLLDGLTEEDDMEMLESRLRALPPTLEQYFEHMLKSIDPTYKRYTARALLLACNAA